LTDRKQIIVGTHDDKVTSVCISTNDEFIISGSKDKTIRLWGIEDQSINNIIGRHYDCVTSVCISRNN